MLHQLMYYTSFCIILMLNLQSTDGEDSSYSPIALVRQMHRMPHMNQHLELEKNDFDIDYNSQWNSYSKSLLTFPILIAVFGCMLLLLFQFWMICRICHEHCRCAPLKFGNSFYDGNRIVHPYAKYLRYLVFLGIIGMIICPQIMLKGSSKLSDGVNTIKDGLDYLSDTFNDLYNYGVQLNYDGDLLLSQFDSAAAHGCSQASGLDSYVQEYLEYVDDYLSYVDPVPDKIDNIHDKVDEYGIDYKNDSVYVMYGTLLLAAAFLFISAVIKKPTCLMSISLIFSDFVIACIITLCTILMIALMLGADFCMDPIEYMLDCIPRSIYDVTKYYSTCQGTNPFQEDLNAAADFVIEATAAVDVLLNNVCQGNGDLFDALGTLGGISKTLDDIDNKADCGPIEHKIQHTINDGVCDETFRGTYYIWLAAYVAAAGLFVYMIICSIAYMYHWPPYFCCFKYQTLDEYRRLLQEEEEVDQSSPSMAAPLLPPRVQSEPTAPMYSTERDSLLSTGSGHPLAVAEGSVNSADSTNHLTVTEAINYRPSDRKSDTISGRSSTPSAPLYEVYSTDDARFSNLTGSSIDTFNHIPPHVSPQSKLPTARKI